MFTTILKVFITPARCTIINPLSFRSAVLTSRDNTSCSSAHISPKVSGTRGESCTRTLLRAVGSKPTVSAVPPPEHCGPEAQSCTGMTSFLRGRCLLVASTQDWSEYIESHNGLPLIRGLLSS